MLFFPFNRQLFSDLKHLIFHFSGHLYKVSVHNKKLLIKLCLAVKKLALYGAIHWENHHHSNISLMPPGWTGEIAKQTVL